MMEELYPIITSLPPKYFHSYRLLYPKHLVVTEIPSSQHAQYMYQSIEPTAMLEITVACIIILEIKLSLYFPVEIDKYYQKLSNAVKPKIK